MANKVFLGDDNFVYHVYDGDQNYEIVKADSEKIVQYCKQLRSENKPVKVVGDYTRIGHADAGSRKAANEALHEASYDKVALFGTSVFHTVAANLIIKASGKAKKVRVFRGWKEAEQWLRK